LLSWSIGLLLDDCCAEYHSERKRKYATTADRALTWELALEEAAAAAAGAAVAGAGAAAARPDNKLSTTTNTKQQAIANVRYA
jgi:hypothetical protein